MDGYTTLIDNAIFFMRRDWRSELEDSSKPLLISAVLARYNDIWRHGKLGIEIWNNWNHEILLFNAIAIISEIIQDCRYIFSNLKTNLAEI